MLPIPLRHSNKWLNLQTYSYNYNNLINLHTYFVNEGWHKSNQNSRETSFQTWLFQGVSISQIYCVTYLVFEVQARTLTLPSNVRYLRESQIWRLWWRFVCLPFICWCTMHQITWINVFPHGRHSVSRHHCRLSLALTCKFCPFLPFIQSSNKDKIRSAQLTFPTISFIRDFIIYVNIHLHARLLHEWQNIIAIFKLFCHWSIVIY